MRFEVGNLQLFGLDLGSLFQRFKSGVADIMPAGLVESFVRPAPVVEAVIAPNQLEFVRKYPNTQPQTIVLQQAEMALAADGAFNADLLRDVKASQLQLHALLPEALVMRKRITLPRVARNNLRSVVSYQVARLTPFSADQVFFDVLEVWTPNPNLQTIEVEFVAALKTEVQPWIDHIERLSGLTVARLTVAPTEQLLKPHAINLFGQQRTRNAWWLRLSRNSVLLAALLTLLLVTAVLPVFKLHSLVLERKAEMRTLSASVTDLQEKREILDHDLVALNYVLVQRASNRTLSIIIEELTRLVPDEIFINSVSIEGQKLAISGMGTGVVDLIELLNSSPLFKDARFTASITRSREGQDIFTANMQINAAVDGQE
ncbi:MAG: PilN domain-containing protein [Pseudomonas sp.]|nr:PilN domain-containing protein [Pseudomonas sp.]